MCPYPDSDLISVGQSAWDDAQQTALTMLLRSMPSRPNHQATFSAKVPFLTDLFLFSMRGHGLERLKKKSNWSVVAFDDGRKGLNALKNLLGSSERIVKKSKYGHVKVWRVSQLAFSFQTKFLRVTGKVVMTKQ